MDCSPDLLRLDLRKGIMRPRFFHVLSLLFLVVALLVPPRAFARALLSTETTCTGSDVTVTTTAETVIGTVTVGAPSSTSFVVRVRFWGVVTTSADSASYKLRVRRTNVSGTALGDAIAQTILVAAGGTEPMYFEFTDERAGSFSSLTYVSTIEIASASATSTVGENCITADILQ